MDQLSIFSVASSKSLSKFLNIVAAQGGMSYSNNFDVEFQFITGGDLKNNGAETNNTELVNRMKSLGIAFGGSVPSDDEDLSFDAGSVLKVMCEEAQLPNTQAATGSYTGRRLGEGQVNYAHTKMYSDFQLGWMCDANMTPLKFLNAWYSYIFNEFDYDGNEIYGKTGTNVGGSTPSSGLRKVNQSLSQIKTATGNLSNPERSIRLKYPDQYQCNIQVTKSEKGKNSPNGRPSMMYTLLDCFPYAIDAVPLSYGASQVTKVTANFYYSKYTIVYNDIRKMEG